MVRISVPRVAVTSTQPALEPADGAVSETTTGPATLGTEILTMPAGFYVNVHNARYPDGAVRGQLVN